jgi:mono/diheme cytochrome c family protein
MTFQVLFGSHCSGCHGKEGQLGPAPPLNDKLFLALIPEAVLQGVITSGRQGTLMPAFGVAKGGSLTPEQIKVLVDGIKTSWGPEGPAPQDAPPYRAMNAGAASKERGLEVFVRACATCHGDRGQGGHYAGQPEGRSVGAISDPDFLALLSNQALRRLVITGRPDLNMPDYAHPDGRPKGWKPLTSQEVTDLVALLGAWRQGGPAHGKEH